PPALYTLSLHDALPISAHQAPLHELVDDIGRAARLHQDALLHLAHRELALVIQHLEHAELGRAELEARDAGAGVALHRIERPGQDRKSTRLNSSHVAIS